METILITLINGISLGGAYAMIALGYTMVYGIAKMLNFAHGDVMMVGGYTLMIFIGMLGHPVLALVCALVLAVLICVLLGIGIEKAAYKPLRGASPLAVLITAIGVSYLLQAISQIVFGSNPRRVGIPEMGSVSLGFAQVKVSTLVTLAVTAIIMVALHLFIKKSKIGRAMVAVSEDRSAAQLMGINVNAIITITFAIGSALAAVACLFFLMESPYISNTFGSLPGIKAFTAAVIGGIGSIPGAMLGGIALGVVECGCNAIGLGSYTDAIEFSLLIIVLLVRPSGFLGKKKREKV